jgi:mono/diheme cytochrome c family protein
MKIRWLSDEVAVRTARGRAKALRYRSRLRYTARNMKRIIWLLLVIVAIVAAAYSETRGAQAPQAPDPGDLAEGLRLYQQKADCRACHGWSADGVKGDNQMPDGPTLREKKYTRELLVLTIKCGRPNTQMPAFDKFAYTDGRCFMMTVADLAKNPTRMPDPPATLQPREIDLIADFLMAKVVGKGPMDYAKCVEFWGSDVAVCKDLKK